MEHGPNVETGSVASTAVRGISHIATLPEVTVKIIELVEDPSSSARDLSCHVALATADIQNTKTSDLSESFEHSGAGGVIGKYRGFRSNPKIGVLVVECFGTGCCFCVHLLVSK